MRAYYALESYSAQRIVALKLRPWLYKITWNVFCDYAERSQLQLSMPLDISDESDLLELEDDQCQQPEKAFEYEELRSELASLVDTLPERYRQVVSLHYLEDRSYQEIADTLSQSTGTVRVSVHRALGLLRKTIEAQSHSTARLNQVAPL